MPTDLNRMSFEANPPFAIQSQDWIARPVRRMRPGVGKPTVAQADTAQWIGFTRFKDIDDFARLLLYSSLVDVDIQKEVRHAHVVEALSLVSTAVAQLHDAVGPVPIRENVWDILESLAGTIEAPPDWSAEHDHYLYGTPKRN